MVAVDLPPSCPSCLSLRSPPERGAHQLPVGPVFSWARVLNKVSWNWWWFKPSGCRLQQAQQLRHVQPGAGTTTHLSQSSPCLRLEVRKLKYISGQSMLEQDFPFSCIDNPPQDQNLI